MIHPVALAIVAVTAGSAVMVVSGANGGAATADQSLINQRISQAALRRSNTALNYLAAIRTTEQDTRNGLSAANPRGVIPLAQVPGAGLGWGQADLAGKHYTAVLSSAGQLLRASAGVSVREESGAADVHVVFPQDVSACTPVVTPASIGPPAHATIYMGGGRPGTEIGVQTWRGTTGSLTDSGWFMVVYCP